MVVALRATFRPEAARGVRASYEVDLGGVVVHALVDGGQVTVGKGPLPDADLVIESGPALKALMAGEMSPREAIETGSVRLRVGNHRLWGDPGLLAWFVEIFRIAPAPVMHDGIDNAMARTAGVSEKAHAAVAEVPVSIGA
jgi:hypothetical protein